MSPPEWVTMKPTKDDEAFKIYCNSCKAFWLWRVLLLNSIAPFEKHNWLILQYSCCSSTLVSSELIVCEFRELFSKALLCSLAPTILIGWNHLKLLEIILFRIPGTIMSAHFEIEVCNCPIYSSFTCWALQKRFHWIAWIFDMAQQFQSIFFQWRWLVKSCQLVQFKTSTWNQPTTLITYVERTTKRLPAVEILVWLKFKFIVIKV